MARLILIRHGKSEWNALGLWTGWTDVELAPEGIEEARRTGETLCDIEIHEAHTSGLKRAKKTFEEIQVTAKCHGIPVKESNALNERHYGVHTGKNKWEVKESVGDEEFNNIRRGWNHPVEGGETLKDVHDRVVQYYKEHIFPQLQKGKNIMVVAHGNSLRALVKHLEDISDEDIANVELNTAEAHCYTFGEDMVCIEKEVRAANSKKV